jgi:glutaredoxin
VAARAAVWPAARAKVVPVPKIVLYSRQGCHLCDDAAALLAGAGLRFETVDIDADPDLRSRYNECVPVVTVDGRERFRGRVHPLLLKRLLDAGDA